MSRTPLVAGNWKMNKTVPQSIELVRELLDGVRGGTGGVEVAIFPPFTSLWTLYQEISLSDIALGAQDIYWEASGAFTGEISPAMVGGWCRYALIGHSERRLYFGETDETVNLKLHAAGAHGLRPMVAVGETLAEHEAGATDAVLRRQVLAALQGVNSALAAELVIAYEPVWAIGTGRTATTEHAQSSSVLIRELAKEALGAEDAAPIRVLYGGSVTPDNAADLFAEPDVDGGLVGGASLQAAQFLAIVAAARRRVAA